MIPIRATELAWRTSSSNREYMSTYTTCLESAMLNINFNVTYSKNSDNIYMKNLEKILENCPKIKKGTIT